MKRSYTPSRYQYLDDSDLAIFKSRNGESGNGTGNEKNLNEKSRNL